MNQEISVAAIFLLSLISGAIALFNVSQDRFNKSTFILFAFCAVSILIGVYLNSSYIDMNKLGAHDKFGQFGDFIGGILNPIFGFLTVLLLIQTTNIQNISLKDQIQATKHNEKIRKIETLNQLINNLEKESKLLLHEKRIEFQGNMFSMTDLFDTSHKISTPEGKAAEEVLNCLDCIHRQDLKNTEPYYFSLIEIVETSERLAELQLELFRIEDYEKAKENIGKGLFRTAFSLSRYNLISQKRAHGIFDEINDFSKNRPESN